jgi:flagellar motor switch protein FliG
MEILKSLDDRQIQEWLRRVDFATLAAALLAAPNDVRNQVFQNLSKKASEVLASTIRRYELLDAKALVIQMSADRLESLV